MRSMLLFSLAMLLCTSAHGAPAETARGEYLTRAGNCAGCHTAPGGQPFAGGRAIDSSFGTFYAPNITADTSTGIGDWSADQFWSALHQGQRADGSLLYPACPYPNFTQVRRDDVDAIYAYLRSLPAVQQANREHELSFPASSRALLSVWQWLYFEPGTFEPDPAQSAEGNRGAYLVEGLGHCSACHAERNGLGAVRTGEAVRGSTVHAWYAPSLHSSAEAGVQKWTPEQAADLLRYGKAGDASALGPMADVVFESLQYLSEDDALAMATYLQSLPDYDIEARRRPSISQERLEAARQLGGTVYEKNCVDCHGADGEGSETAPALAGNRAVTMSDQTNLRNIIRHGGYPASTEANPRPLGMPPFYKLSSKEFEAVVTYIRSSWGNRPAEDGGR